MSYILLVVIFAFDYFSSLGCCLLFLFIGVVVQEESPEINFVHQHWIIVCLFVGVMGGSDVILFSSINYDKESSSSFMMRRGAGLVWGWG